MKNIYAFFIFCVLSTTTFAANDWKISATKLSGDPEVRAQGLKELNEIKNLSEQLRMSFKKDPSLVLQVIRDLKMHDFVPRLFEIITNASAADLSSDVISTATYLSSEKNVKELTALYSKKLETPKISDSATLALIQGLEKYNYPIEEQKLLSLLEHPSYEIRVAAVEMASRLAKNKPAYEKVFQKAITTSPYQVRMVAYSEYLTNTDLKKSHQADLTKACVQEKNDQVKELCLKLNGGKK